MFMIVFIVVRHRFRVVMCMNTASGISVSSRIRIHISSRCSIHTSVRGRSSVSVSVCSCSCIRVRSVSISVRIRIGIRIRITSRCLTFVICRIRTIIMFGIMCRLMMIVSINVRSIRVIMFVRLRVVMMLLVRSHISIVLTRIFSGVSLIDVMHLLRAAMSTIIVIVVMSVISKRRVLCMCVLLSCIITIRSASPLRIIVCLGIRLIFIVIIRMRRLSIVRVPLGSMCSRMSVLNHIICSCITIFAVVVLVA